MTAALAVFAAALCVSVVLTPVVRLLAVRFGRLDHVLEARKIHSAPVPRLGGVAIVAACAAVLAAAWGIDAESVGVFRQDGNEFVAIAAGAALVVALGIYDDLVGVGARGKLTVQLTAAVIAWTAGLHIDALQLPVVGTIELGVLSAPLTLLWIVGVTNAFNLIDGMDGLAGGVALIALAALGAIAFGRGDAAVVVLAAALGGAVLGFLFFNWNPASIFMGDTGSLFLGFVLATTSLRVAHDEPTGVSLLVPVLALGLPIADTLLAIVRRALRGDPLFMADRGHIHHRLLALGLSQRQAAVVLYASAACLGATALVLTRASDAVALTTIALVLTPIGLALFWLTVPAPLYALQVRAARRRAAPAESRNDAARPAA